MRLFSAGWEISNRLGAFVSVGAGFALAAALMQTSQLRRIMGRYGALAVLLTVVIVGGVMNGWGLDAIRTSYMVGAYSQSVEPLGIAVANWTRKFRRTEPICRRPDQCDSLVDLRTSNSLVHACWRSIGVRFVL